MTIDPNYSTKDKFTSHVGEMVFSQCTYCRHRSRGFLMVCPAFPGQIPEEILLNKFDHRRPHPDEIDPVRFEPRPEIPAAHMTQLFRELDALPHPQSTR